MAQSNAEQVNSLNHYKLRLAVVLSKSQGTDRDIYVTITNISGTPLALNQYNLVQEGPGKAISIQCQDIAGETIGLTPDQSISLKKLLGAEPLQGISKQPTLVLEPNKGISNPELTLYICI